KNLSALFLSIAFFASSSEASFLPSSVFLLFNLPKNKIPLLLESATCFLIDSSILVIFSNAPNLVFTADIILCTPASNDPFLLASVSNPPSLLIFFPIALASSSIDLTKVSTSLTLVAKSLASFIFLLIFAKSSTVPSDLAACPSLGEVPELLQDMSKNKVINNAHKVILFIITCLLLYSTQEGKIVNKF
ncbi:hypothetical protein BHY_1577, partial (plasmid) [Borrelia nietonii YOR]